MLLFCRLLFDKLQIASTFLLRSDDSCRLSRNIFVVAGCVSDWFVGDDDVWRSKEETLDDSKTRNMSKDNGKLILPDKILGA